MVVGESNPAPEPQYRAVDGGLYPSPQHKLDQARDRSGLIQSSGSLCCDAISQTPSEPAYCSRCGCYLDHYMRNHKSLAN
jgi:hypothetical protein